MERARSKSKNRAIKKKTNTSPVRRGRPRKTPANKSPARAATSRSRQPKGRSRSRSRSAVKQKKAAPREISDSEEEFVIPPRRRSVRQRPVNSQPPAQEENDDDKPLKIHEIVRNSVERSLTPRVNLIRMAASKSVNSGGKFIPINIPKEEFGGTLGAAASVLILAGIVAGLLLGCTREQCTLQPFHVPRNWQYYLGGDAAIGVVAFFLLQFVLAALPVGKVINFKSGFSYRANGFLALQLTAAAVAALWYFKYNITITYERHVKAAVAAYIFSLLISLCLYLKGGKASFVNRNLWGNTGNRLYDFILGRETNPLWFNRINVKIVLLRFCLIGSVLIDCLICLKAFEVRKEWSWTLNTLVGLKVFYCLDSLWFEDSFSSTFEAQYEGAGLMQVQGFLLFPFYAAVLPRFVLQYRVERPPWLLAYSVAFFIFGYYIYRQSNLQKATFRKNPTDKVISGLETIQTNVGKNLLVGGWWGFVKHPNYLGDIMMQWAIAMNVGFTHALPYTVPLVTTLFLLSRASRDAARCKDRYKGAWDEYHARVPYSVIPYIY